MAQELSDNDKIVDKYGDDKTALIQTLIDIQREDRWFPKSALTCVSEKLGVSINQIHRILGAISEVAQELGNTDKIINKYGGDKTALIQILLDIQQENRWLPKSVLMCVSEKLGVPLNQVYQVATFYKAFSLTPQGRHSVLICMGTACHVRGSPRLLDKVMDALNIGPGETSPDQKFTLDTVNCLGCCALGPVLVVEGEYHSNPSAKEIEGIFSACD